MYHFISGLPRSGSTLLAAILRQNPAFHADIISPLGPIVQKFLDATGPNEETHSRVTELQRLRCIEALFDAFHEEHLDKLACFDTNRAWTQRINLLTSIFPTSRVIACVRPLGQIIDSLERVFREHPTMTSRIYGCDNSWTVFQRVNHMISSQGVIGYAWDALREAYYGPRKERLIIVDYNILVAHPKETMDALHEELGFEPFKYNFKKIEQIPGAAEFDLSIGTPGLHIVAPHIFVKPWKPCLPEQIYPTLAQLFWYEERKNNDPSSLPET
jgi:sulfotransferase